MRPMASTNTRMNALPPREVKREDLLLAHTPVYLDLAEREIRRFKGPSRYVHKRDPIMWFGHES